MLACVYGLGTFLLNMHPGLFLFIIIFTLSDRDEFRRNYVWHLITYQEFDLQTNLDPSTRSSVYALSLWVSPAKAIVNGLYNPRTFTAVSFIIFIISSSSDICSIKRLNQTVNRIEARHVQKTTVEGGCLFSCHIVLISGHCMRHLFAWLATRGVSSILHHASPFH